MISRGPHATCISAFYGGLWSGSRADLRGLRDLYIRVLSRPDVGAGTSRRGGLLRHGRPGGSHVTLLLAVSAEVTAVHRLRQPRLHVPVPATEVLTVGRLPEPLLIGLALPFLRALRQATGLLVLDVRLGSEKASAVATTATTTSNHRCTPAGALRRTWPTASKGSTHYGAYGGGESAQKPDLALQAALQKSEAQVKGKQGEPWLGYVSCSRPRQ